MSDHYYIKQALSEPDAEAISLLAGLLPELRAVFLLDDLVEQSEYDRVVDGWEKEEAEVERLSDLVDDLEDETDDLREELAEACRLLAEVERERDNLVEENRRLTDQLAAAVGPINWRD